MNDISFAMPALNFETLDILGTNYTWPLLGRMILVGTCLVSFEMTDVVEQVCALYFLFKLRWQYQALARCSVLPSNTGDLRGLESHKTLLKGNDFLGVVATYA
jgi:hypothetical protein